MNSPSAGFSADNSFRSLTWIPSEYRVAALPGCSEVAASADGIRPCRNGSFALRAAASGQQPKWAPALHAGSRGSEIEQEACEFGIRLDVRTDAVKRTSFAHPERAGGAGAALMPAHRILERACVWLGLHQTT